MERLNDDRMRLVLVGVVTAMVFCGSAKADFTFGEPTPLDATINSGGHPCFDCISADGLEMYIDKPTNGNPWSNSWDIFVSTRATPNDSWSVPVNLGYPVNSNKLDGYACLSSDGLTLYFAGHRPGGYGAQDIWVTTRPYKGAHWAIPENLGPTINTSSYDSTPWITPDGLVLYFSSDRPGGSGNDDLWVAKRPTTEDNWGNPVNLGPLVNSAAYDSFPCISANGSVLLFSEYPIQGPLRPGGFGRSDIWMTTRETSERVPEGYWIEPQNLGPLVNSPDWDAQPRLSPDDSFLYYSSERPGAPAGGWNIWQAPILPIVDLNGDGIVDADDICIMVDHWGTDYSLCDIGPTPLGDGVVDVEDLKVLAEHLFEEVPPIQ